MKKILLFFGVLLSVIALVGCNKTQNVQVEKVIEEAQKLTFDQLVEKAYEESKGKTFKGVGNSSRGKSVLPKFVEYIKSKHADYTLTTEWSQPKENNIFKQLSSDAIGEMAVTLIQDAAQIQSKMLDTKVLLNFIPKDWKEANGVNVTEDGNPLALQTLSKVFMYNSNEGPAGEPAKQFKNVWEFVAKDEHPLFMGLDSEPVGKNFLIMLTQEKYVKIVKEAYEKLDQTAKAYFKPIIDGLKDKAKELKLVADAEYSLAWIKLYVEQFKKDEDDAPICNSLTAKASYGKTGLLVYSKLRSIKETTEQSVNNIKVAAYEDGFSGFGGYAYKHYLLIPKNSKLPWTAAAFITFMVTKAEGFEPWGKDIGGYSSNPNINQDHSKDGFVDGQNKYPAKNDKGYTWWMNTGKLVLENPKYCADNAFTVGRWIDNIKK